MKKLISITLIAVLIVSCFTFAASAESKVNLRIEGKDATFFNASVSIVENTTVFDVMKAVSDNNESVNMIVTESEYGDYISGINGDNADTINIPDENDPEKSTTYYIGWLFAVDNIMSGIGASYYQLKGGEDIVFFYGDMNSQMPVADFSEKGKIKLTSYDYLPDWSGMDWFPVKDAKVTLNNKEYTSDENGVVTYNPEDFKCLVNVQIEKFDALGYPMVCRFEDNFGFDVTSLTEPTQPTEPPTEPKPVTLNYKTSLYVQGTYRIDLSTEEAVTYSTSNNKVAVVSTSGKITAKKAGTAVITAKAGKTTAKYKVTVKNPTLSCTKKTLKKGKSFTLKVTGAVGKVTYSSSKKSVAAVTSKGKVTAKKKGKAVIKVKTNGMTLKCTVTVK